MNNLKTLLYLPKRSRYIIVLLFFLSFISFLSFPQRVFASDAPEQAAKEAPAPGVELPQFEAGQAPASSQAPEGQPAGESGTATAAVEEEEAGPVQYRAFFGIDSRLIVWIVSELHLMFAAFVLGVPIFAVIVVIVGFKGGGVKFGLLGLGVLWLCLFCFLVLCLTCLVRGLCSSPIHGQHT